MVKFVAVDPANIDTSRSGRRGRVSYPIIKAFMEQNVKVVKIDPDSLGEKNPAYLRSVLQTYINNHGLPIKIFQANGDLHLMRLDLDNHGNPIEHNEEKTTEGAAGHLRNLTPTPLTPEEVGRRFEEEKAQTLK